MTLHDKYMDASEHSLYELILLAYEGAFTKNNWLYNPTYTIKAHEGGNIEGEMKFDQYISLVTRGVTSYVCNNNMVYA